MPEITKKSSDKKQLGIAQEKQEVQGRRVVMVNEPHRADSGLIIVLVLLVAIGLVALFSASMAASVDASGQGTSYLMRQIFANLLGAGIIFFLVRFNLKSLDKPSLAFFMYVVVCMLLFITFFTNPINGSRRWIPVPIIGQFQPSELMKVSLVYLIASYESWLNKQKAAGRIEFGRPGIKSAFRDAIWDAFVPLGIAFVPITLTLMQPHLSGAVILSMVTLVCLLAAGIPARSWLVTLGVGTTILVILLSLFLLLKPVLPEKLLKNFAHVETRIGIFLGKEDVTEDEDYQTRQGKIALGSGGLLGVGLGKGKQKNNYLPEGYNDYIFSNWVEEMGFVGGVAVLLLFLTFFFLGLKVTFRANSVYSQIVAGGISSLITTQALLNIGVNVGAIPPTGISLPFFSYGGSANLFFLIGIGLLLNVSKYGTSRKEIAAAAEVTA